MPVVRFRELVKAAGKPEVKSLWLDPTTDCEFMRAVNQRRVLTIVQEPQSKRKDFGQVGFHQQPHAAYFVFRKPLEIERGAKVIGIDYNLVEEPALTRSIPPRNSRTQPKLRTPARARTEKRTPPKKHFIVLVRRTAVIESSNAVEADTKSQAREQAVALACKEPFDISKAIVKVEAIDVRS